MFSSIGSKFLALLAVAWAGVANAQLTYLDGTAIVPGWTGSTNAVGPGNGAFTSPDGSMVVVVSKDASAKAFDIITGAEMWTFPAPSATATSTSGIFYSYSAASPYLCFSYVDSNMTSIVALSPTGSLILTAGPVAGVAVGTPVTTEDGDYIMTTYNSGAQGFFAIFEISQPGTPLYTYQHPTIVDEPFGAVGYYWSPTEGNFPEGQLNPNDLFLWSFDTNLDLNNGTVGTGQVFAFQMPTNPMTPMNVTLVEGDRPFQSKLGPVITDNGLSMYWSTSRSRTYAWVGDGSGRTDFTTNGVGLVELTRGSPFSDAADAPPTLSNANGTDGFVVGLGANAEIFRLDRNFSDAPLIVPTATIISTRLLVSPDDMFVYYATQTPDNSLYQVDSDTLTEVWKLSLAASIEGNIAMSKNGASIIVVDSAGAVTSFTVATAGPTPPPVAAPMSAPVDTPVPGGTPSTPPPSDLDTMGPSNTRVPSETPPTGDTTPTAPVAGPVAGPVAAPVRPPSTPTVPTASGAVSQFLFSVVSATILATMMALMV